MPKISIKVVVSLVVGTLFVLSFVVGMATSTNQRIGSKNGCPHVSIASFNPPYLLGCELFKKRFNLDNLDN